MKLLPKHYYQFYIGCIRLYGVIDSDSAFLIFKKYYPESLKKDFLKDIRTRNGKYTKKYIIWTTYKKNLYLIADDWYNQKDIELIFSLQEDKPFYIPNTLEEFINCSSFEYWKIFNKKYIDGLSSILSKNTKFKVESTLETIFETIRYLSRQSHFEPLGEITKRLIKWGYDFNEQELTSVVALLQEIVNNTKMPCNRGYTPLELKQYYLDNKDIPNC